MFLNKVFLQNFQTAEILESHIAKIHKGESTQLTVQLPNISAPIDLEQDPEMPVDLSADGISRMRNPNLLGKELWAL